MFRGRIYEVRPLIKWRFPEGVNAFYVDETDTEGTKVFLDLNLTQPLLCQFHNEQLVLNFEKEVDCPKCLATEMK